MLRRIGQVGFRKLSRNTRATQLAQYGDWGLAYTAYLAQKGKPNPRKDHIVKICKDLHDLRPTEVITDAFDKAEEKALEAAVTNPREAGQVVGAVTQGLTQMGKSLRTLTAPAAAPPANTQPRGPTARERATGFLRGLVPQGTHQLFNTEEGARPKVIQKRGTFYNEYGHKIGNVPATKKNFLSKNTNRNKVIYPLRMKKSKGAPEKTEAEIKAMGVNDKNYGLYPGQFKLPTKFYYRLRANTAKLESEGGYRKGPSKKSRTRKVRL